MKNKSRKFIQCVNNSNKEVTPIETIYAIKNAGFDGVFLQWYNKGWEVSQEKQLETCRNLGLEIPFVHLSYKNINDIWEDSDDGEIIAKFYSNELEICKKNNIEMVVMHLTSGTSAKEPNELGIERLKQIIHYAENLGIKIAFENTKIKGYLEYVFENIRSENIGVCFDSGHCHCHFDDEFNWQFFKNKILLVHLHDNDTSGDQHLLPFDGTIDWVKYAENLISANYNGPVVLENCYRKDYLKMTIDEFYELALKRAKEIKI